MKEKVNGRYAYSRDGAEFCGDEPTIGDAIRAAGEDFCGYPLKSLLVGACTTIRATEEDIAACDPAGNLLDCLHELGVGEYGEYAECWLGEVTEAQTAELNAAIGHAAVKWMDRNGLHPDWYGIDAVQAIGEVMKDAG